MSGRTEDSPSSAPPSGNTRSWGFVRCACRYLVAAVFLMASLSKITDLRSFETQMSEHSRLPGAVIQPVVAVLPWLELTCGLCLALGHAVREAAFVVQILLVVFTADWLIDRSGPDCGCLFLPISLPKVAWLHVPGNILLFLCCASLVWTGRRR